MELFLALVSLDLSSATLTTRGHGVDDLEGFRASAERAHGAARQTLNKERRAFWANVARAYERLAASHKYLDETGARRESAAVVFFRKLKQLRWPKWRALPQGLSLFF